MRWGLIAIVWFLGCGVVDAQLVGTRDWDGAIIVSVGAATSCPTCGTSQSVRTYAPQTRYYVPRTRYYVPRTRYDVPRTQYSAPLYYSPRSYVRPAYARPYASGPVLSGVRSVLSSLCPAGMSMTAAGT